MDRVQRYKFCRARLPFRIWQFYAFPATFKEHSQMPVADYAGAFFLLVTRHALRSIDGRFLRILAWRSASNINYSTVVFNFDVCLLSYPISSTNYDQM